MEIHVESMQKSFRTPLNPKETFVETLIEFLQKACPIEILQHPDRDPDIILIEILQNPFQKSCQNPFRNPWITLQTPYNIHSKSFRIPMKSFQNSFRIYLNPCRHSYTNYLIETPWNPYSTPHSILIETHVESLQKPSRFPLVPQRLHIGIHIENLQNPFEPLWNDCRNPYIILIESLSYRNPPES